MTETETKYEHVMHNPNCDSHCIYCNSSSYGRHDNKCSRPLVLEVSGERKVNKILDDGQYNLFAAVPVTFGRSRMGPHGDGSSSGSGITSTSICYVLKKKVKRQKK